MTKKSTQKISKKNTKEIVKKVAKKISKELAKNKVKTSTTNSSKNLEKSLVKKSRVYLDFASQTMPSKKVLDEIKKIAAQDFNPANLYSEGVEAENILSSARSRVAKVLGVREHEIYFTTSGTLSSATAILGIFNEYKKQAHTKKALNNKAKKPILPHIITSNIEHPAVLENIKFLESSGQIEATFVEVNQDGLIDKEEIKKHIKKNTILISIMYVNNEIGTIQDIKNISKSIKEWKRENSRSILDYPHFHTDAAQAGNYLSLYVDTLGVDLLSLNGSKIYGTKSTAILFKKEYIKISPIYFGGDQERGLFSGTVNVSHAAGLAVAVEEANLRSKNSKELERIASLRNNLAKNILKNIPEARINGHMNEFEWKEEKINIGREDRIPKRTPSSLSIYLPDFPSDEMVIRLDQKGFSVSAGSACSARESEYSKVIYSLYKNSLKDSVAKKIAQESIRVTIDHNTKIEDLKLFVKTITSIYFKFKK